MVYRDEVQAENDLLKAANGRLEEEIEKLKSKPKKKLRNREVRESIKNFVMAFVVPILFVLFVGTMFVAAIFGAKDCIKNEESLEKKNTAICEKACAWMPSLIGVDWHHYRDDMIKCSCIPTSGKIKRVRALKGKSK